MTTKGRCTENSRQIAKFIYKCDSYLLTPFGDSNNWCKVISANNFNYDELYFYLFHLYLDRNAFGIWAFIEKIAMFSMHFGPDTQVYNDSREIGKIQTKMNQIIIDFDTGLVLSHKNYKKDKRKQLEKEIKKQNKENNVVVLLVTREVDTMVCLNPIL